VNGERACDFRARHELVRGVDDALGGVVEGREGVLEEVEVAFVAFGAFVDDLRKSISGRLLSWTTFRGSWIYHSSNRLPSMGDLHATTAVGAFVPHLSAERSAIEACGQRVSGERTGAALHVAAVESGFARDGTAGEVVCVVTLSRDGGGEGRADQCEGREKSVEKHVDG
jgi:hypothetical protein